MPPVIKPVTYGLPGESKICGYMFFCPGCQYDHYIPIILQHGQVHATWTFNGNEAAPSFGPSVRHTSTYSDPPARHVCHYIITDGVIHFQNDCTHALNGQKYTMPQINQQEE